MLTINDIVLKKGKEKISMLTAYDYTSSKFADQAGIDIILVGDSLGMVTLGYDSTLPVSLDEMIYHSKIVSRARENAFLVVDMPYLTYNVDIKDSVYNAGRIIKETGAQAVKIEGGKRSLETIKKLVEMEIPVMGHLGLTPQSMHRMGGFKIQGKDNETANEMIKDAKLLEKVGVFSIVLEGIPQNLAKKITDEIGIPTIGIGAGADTDGQVLVYNDVLGFTEKPAKFVKQYINGKEIIKEAISSYVKDVKNGVFPNKENIYKVKADLERLY